ncbi:hypothetical protein BCV69DRAFT_283028 [Microstroma glucosiphilum]|uniref:R3H domain-containing protein n=1 Tax=Pseudomicrostroma glucosiphilum TaxID=1684307 RepID=A0A316U6G9_9BASI|nr:hypothetical protein BCV69DRAFT_283028 [Pseudomicrostroma glucosiphilum]PWN20812.1 hypothetical protein BCV69DRAFT_283028 [Pseudomicrostroma glucosiphilum]
MVDFQQQQPPLPPSTSGPINPVPLSLPSILVNAKPRGNPTTKHSRPPLSSSSSAPPRAKVARQPGKRKLLRLENARFSTAINPHIVRPRPSDYSPGYESRRYKGSFQQPIPGLVKELGRGEEVPRDGREVRDWRREMDEVKKVKRAAGSESRRGEGTPASPTTSALNTPPPPPSGLFTMSLPEARFFLKRRAVVETRLDSGHASSAAPSSSSSSPTMQSLVDLVEDDFASWKEQVVYLLDAEATSNQADTTRLNPRPRLVVASSSSLAQARVEEHHHLPHSLSYLIPDSFDRLTVHCLARLWGLKSLSKSINHNGEELKLTWIFKPPPSSRRAQAHLTQPSRGGVRGSAPAPRAHLNPLIRHLARSEPASLSTRTSRLSGTATSHGLDTPPATDISSQSEFEEGEGTDVDTIESASVASLPSSGADSGSELGGLSDVGEAEEGEGEDIGEETLRPPDSDTDALIVPVRRRLEELTLAGDDTEDALDEIESLPSSRGEREYEAEAEDDGEWQEIEDDHLE